MGGVSIIHSVTLANKSIIAIHSVMILSLRMSLSVIDMTYVDPTLGF